MSADIAINRNPALEPIEILIGEWDMELSNAAFLPRADEKIRIGVSIESIEDGAFIILRMGGNPSMSHAMAHIERRGESGLQSILLRRSKGFTDLRDEHIGEHLEDVAQFHGFFAAVRGYDQRRSKDNTWVVAKIDGPKELGT
jgi:hypothetical protein